MFSNSSKAIFAIFLRKKASRSPARLQSRFFSRSTLHEPWERDLPQRPSSLRDLSHPLRNQFVLNFPRTSPKKKTHTQSPFHFSWRISSTSIKYVQHPHQMLEHDAM